MKNSRNVKDKIRENMWVINCKVTKVTTD